MPVLNELGACAESGNEHGLRDNEQALYLTIGRVIKAFSYDSDLWRGKLRMVVWRRLTMGKFR